MRQFAALVAGLVMVATACSSGNSDDATSSSPTDVGESVDAVPARDLPAVPSAACTDGVRLPSGDADRTIASGGVERSYVLSVPTGYDGTTPMPVVVDFHGYLEGAKVHTAMSELRTLGEAEGFVTVTPQGTGKVPSWNFTPTVPTCRSSTISSTSSNRRCVSTPRACTPRECRTEP
ncbi:MAG: hypothetical protein M5U31_00740 [Acidimicrobiia bacterium]|nr:hypothetical protein [Acidimicrobiia bacterium]